jgi:hypothetical protein
MSRIRVCPHNASTLCKEHIVMETSCITMHHESTQSAVKGFIFTFEKLTLTQTTQFQSSISGNILDTPLHIVLPEVTPVHKGRNVNSQQ